MAETVGTKRLHALGQTVERNTGGEFLGVGGGDSDVLAAVEGGGGVIGHQARGMGVGGDISELPSQALKIG